MTEIIRGNTALTSYEINTYESPATVRGSGFVGPTSLVTLDGEFLVSAWGVSQRNHTSNSWNGHQIYSDVISGFPLDFDGAPLVSMSKDGRTILLGKYVEDVEYPDLSTGDGYRYIVLGYNYTSKSFTFKYDSGNIAGYAEKIVISPDALAIAIVGMDTAYGPGPTVIEGVRFHVLNSSGSFVSSVSASSSITSSGSHVVTWNNNVVSDTFLVLQVTSSAGGVQVFTHDSVDNDLKQSSFVSADYIDSSYSNRGGYYSSDFNNPLFPVFMSSTDGEKLFIPGWTRDSVSLEEWWSILEFDYDETPVTANGQTKLSYNSIAISDPTQTYIFQGTISAGDGSRIVAMATNPSVENKIMIISKDSSDVWSIDWDEVVEASMQSRTMSLFDDEFNPDPPSSTKRRTNYNWLRPALKPLT